MQNKYLAIGLIIFCVASIGVRVRGGLSPSPRSDVRIPQFQGMSNGAIESVVVRIRNGYLGMSSDLLRQLRQRGLKNRPEAAIIHLLGCMRSGGAVPHLLKRITFSSAIPLATFHLPDGGGIVDAAFWGEHPAVNALISIGMPSVRAVLKALPTEVVPLRQRLMVQVLVVVEGQAVAKFRLKLLIAKAATAAVKTNLTAALIDVDAPMPLSVLRSRSSR